MNTKHSIIQRINDAFLTKRGIVLYIKRDDLIHEVVSGNKWRKLKYNIAMCESMKNLGVLTFGGAYSNHLIATAAACNLVGLKSIGVVRGDELNENSNETLKTCSDFGMKLVFVTRHEYSLRYEKAYQEDLSYQYSNYYIVPEGGANYYGMMGCQELMSEIDFAPDHIFLAQGTTTTSCGVLMALNEKQKLHVVPVLKGYESIAEMRDLMLKSGLERDWVEERLRQVVQHSEYHFGGYGKYTDELLTFVRNFFKEHGLKLDPIYTGKAMFALMDEIQHSFYTDKKILFIHTGGIQGAKSIEVKAGITLYE